MSRYPRLIDRFAPVPIGQWPTPVMEARRFAALKGLAALYVKREDLAHSVVGGNKTRGLEFLLGEARRREARMILTIGAVGSHHVAATAYHARQLDMDTIAFVVSQPPAAYVRGNVLLGLEADSKYIPVNHLTLIPHVLARRWLRSLVGACPRPFYIPPGGTTPLSCLGHVNAALELKQQIDAGLLPEPDYLYVALGSLGTAAGLALGCKLAGLRTKIVGVVAAYRWYATRGRWARLARRTQRLMRKADPTVADVGVDRRELAVVTTALGSGYARPTAESLRLIQEMRDTEGLELDTTYTAKTLHGMLQYIERHRLSDRTHLFWHTYHRVPEQSPSPSRQCLPAALHHYFAELAATVCSPYDVANCSGGKCCQSPSGSGNVGMPLSADAPAPENNTMCFASRRISAARASSAP